QVTFAVERSVSPGKRGRTRPRVELLGEGKDLAALQAELAPAVRTTMARAAASIERTGLTSWTEAIGILPETFEQQVAGKTVVGYPALVDTGSAVDVRVLGTASERDRATRVGVRRLLLLNTTPPWKRLLALLTNQQKLSLGHNPHGSVPALLEDALACAVDSVVAEMPGARVRTPEEFDRALATVKQQAVPRVLQIVESLAPILDTAREVALGLQRLTAPAAADMATDLRQQLDSLIRPGFVADTGYRRLPHLRRYLAAMSERLEKGAQDLAKDRDRMATARALVREYAEFLANLPRHRRAEEAVVDIGWQLQELRVSLFAQRLGSPQPVSPKRLYAAMDRAEDVV